jgi:chemotaxis family two-component system sensor histidine kinase/response regulator PixL
LIIEPDEIFQVGNKRYLQWQGQMIPLFQLSELFKGNLLIPGIGVGKVLEEPPSSGCKAPLRLVIKLEKKTVALESSIEKLVTQPKLVIDRFTAALSPAEYCYGFTVLEDERLATVVDLDLLLKHTLSQPPATHDAIALPEEQESHSVETPFSSQINSTITSAISPTVLVIDNTQDRKSDLSFMLEEQGYQVIQLKSGQEAIAKLRNYSGIKLVICEFETQDLSDIMFLNERMFLAYRLKDLHLAKIPFVLISSCRSSRLQTVSMLMGATTYFNKPYDLKEFSAKIKQIMKLA